jgi:hypothetical protein
MTEMTDNKNESDKEMDFIASLWRAMSSGEAMMSDDREQVVRMLDDKQLEAEFEESYRSFMSEPRDRQKDIADGQESFHRLKAKYSIARESAKMEKKTSPPTASPASLVRQEGVIQDIADSAQPLSPSTYTSVSLVSQGRRKADSKRPVAARPVFRRMVLRAAAVLVPLMIVGGAALFFNLGGDTFPVVTERIEDKTDNAAVHEQVMEQEVSQPEDSAVNVTVEAPINHAAAFPISADHVEDAIEYETIRERAGNEPRAIMLPDGSTVRLRRNSSISYASNFLDNRTLELSGDAFFSVAKMGGQPFEVFYNDMTVRVLGTEFLLSTTETSSLVTLKSGSVEVASASQSVTLEPNQRLTVESASGRLSISELTAADMESILRGELILRNEPLNAALAKIGRFFGVRVNNMSGLPAGSVTIEIKSYDKLEDVLFAVQQISDSGFDYEITGTDVVVRGMKRE